MSSHPSAPSLPHSEGGHSHHHPHEHEHDVHGGHGHGVHGGHGHGENGGRECDHCEDENCGTPNDPNKSLLATMISRSKAANLASM
jgi:hypothetical protein